MPLLSPSIVLMVIGSTAAQVAGVSIMPYTKGLTAPLPTIAMFLCMMTGVGLLARLAHSGVNLSTIVPLVSAAVPLAAILIGVVVLGDSASIAKVTLLVGACGLVLISSYI
ncbi:MAG TPA: hypothetical protein VFB63_08505 [Bryobacteraceae bacterium]|nr:hypothetical protein [Bryobacteraceae bacterium]